MAKYTINHTCGHTSTADIVGTNVNGERERKAEWMASRPCADCARAANTAAAAEANSGLPALTGSDKQIAWAETIRAKAAALVAAEIGRGVQTGQITADQAEMIVTAIISERTDSRWWIDNRDASGQGICKAIGQDRYFAILTAAGVTR